MNDATLLQLLMAGIAAALVGFSKTGMVGMGILTVPLLASIVDAKASVGVLVPMLIFGDLFAVTYYRRHADWRLLLKLLPWVLPGLALGFVTLKGIDTEQFAPVLGWLVLGMMALNLVKQRYNAWFEANVPHAWWFSAIMGFLAGFTTMVGNVAGPIMSLYLISMGMRKHEFMGTGAYYYLIVNSLKVPLLAPIGLITWDTLAFNAQVAPLIALGAVVGILVFNVIPQTWFNRIVLGLATLAALKLVVS